jgi:hypothetical protein
MARWQSEGREGREKKKKNLCSRRRPKKEKNNPDHPLSDLSLPTDLQHLLHYQTCKRIELARPHCPAIYSPARLETNLYTRRLAVARRIGTQLARNRSID